MVIRALVILKLHCARRREGVTDTASVTTAATTPAACQLAHNVVASARCVTGAHVGLRHSKLCEQVAHTSLVHAHLIHGSNLISARSRGIVGSLGQAIHQPRVHGRSDLIQF